MHKCPSCDTYVQTAQGYVAVKALPPVGLDAEGEGLFRDVIPDGSARALSRYSELVDGLIREQMEALAGASDDARLRLREWDLPDALQACPEAEAHWGSHNTCRVLSIKVW